MGPFVLFKSVILCQKSYTRTRWLLRQFLVSLGLQAVTNLIYMYMSLFSYNSELLRVINDEQVSGLCKMCILLIQLYSFFLILPLLLFLLDLALWVLSDCRYQGIFTWNGGARQELKDFGKPFDPETFTDNKDCSICLEPFCKDELVLSLPCDVRHYFHIHCIEEWSR